MEKDQVLKFVEELLVKYGAVINPGDDPELCEKLGIRPSYIRNGIYYRTELAAFEEDEVVLISATDNPEYAKIGAHDNIAGFSVSNLIRTRIPNTNYNRRSKYANFF